MSHPRGSCRHDRGLAMARIRLILLGAVAGLAWAASLRGYMMQLAGPTSAFTFSGTFGIILPSGTLVGALLGWAEYQRRAGHRYRMLIGAPLLLAVIPNLLTAGPDLAPVGLAVLAMAGGYAVSGRGPSWARGVAGAIALAAVIPPYAAPKPYPDLSVTTAHGAWAATLASSLYVVFALASSIPMRLPDLLRNPAGQLSAAENADPQRTAGTASGGAPAV
jgi:hypothetical protein